MVIENLASKEYNSAMNERVGQHEQVPQIPLFDEIPQELKSKAALIKEIFDGTINDQGISMVLNPTNGDAILARLINLQTGKTVTYEPLARGRWTNYMGDLKEESPEYQKLERVYEDVRRQYEDWKTDPYRQNFPMREWTTTKVKMQSLSKVKPISPEEWYKKVINPFDEVPLSEQEVVKRGANYRRPSRQKTSRVQRIPVIIPSKDGPRLNDAKPTPIGLRRSVDKEVKRLSRSKS